MKVDFSVPLRELDGTEIVLDELVLTLGVACIRALQAPDPEDQRLQPEQAIERYRFAMALASGGEQDVTPEQASLLRGKLCRSFTAILAGQACEYLS